MTTATLDIEQPADLLAYLRRRGLIASNEHVQMASLQGGVSNRTVLVTRAGGEAWVVKQALPKLRVEVDWFSSPARIHREALGLRWLQELAPPGSTPAFVCEDFDEQLLVMTAVPQPHANWKTLLLQGEIDGGCIDQFAALLGTLHRQGWEQREAVEPAFADASFFESLRLEPYYGYSAGQVPQASHFLHDLADSTLRRRLTLVHGDYSPKNVLIHEGRVVLLDHEVIHFGDPAFDLGFSLTHLLSKAHHLPDLRYLFAEAAGRYWRTYAATLGVVPWAGDLEVWTVRHTLACLLARVAGRSRLEYLSASERANQQEAVLSLIEAPPATIPSLIFRFLAAVSNRERQCH